MLLVCAVAKFVSPVAAINAIAMNFFFMCLKVLKSLLQMYGRRKVNAR